MENTDSFKTQFATITKYFSKYKKYLVMGSLAVIFANVLMLLTPYFSKLVFDALEENQPLSVIGNYVLIVIGLALFSGLFRFMMRRTIIWMSRYVEYDLRSEIYDHLIKLTPNYYHQNRIGDIMARMTNDLEAVRQVVGPGVMYISDTILKLVISFGFMIYLSPRLTMYAVIPMIIMPFAVNFIGNMLHSRSMKVQQKFSDITATAQENLSGIRVVKAYRQEENEIGHFGDLSKNYINLNMSLAKLQGIFIPSMRLISAVSYLVVFYFGGLEIINGDLKLGDIVAFFGYLSMILWPMIAIGWVTSLYQRGKASLKRINNILFTQPDVSNNGHHVDSSQLKGKIEFKNLNFSYDSIPVLTDINLTIEAGQSIGLVGKTGCGKTTLVSLLARLYAVKREMIFIDGVDINDWPLESLRKKIGFATQEPFLFSQTVKENIHFGNESASDEQIEQAANMAALIKDIDTFPNGFETVVGERGITLSGGQKQRTAIARAIVTDPAILIFDDATSAVDTETEDEINERIKEVLTGRTSIIISHRVSSVKDTDMILYLENGRIVEQGNHDELLKLKGNYAELYRSQLLEIELEQL